MKSARAASEPGNSHRHLRLSGFGDVVDDDRHGAGACRRQRRRTRRPDHCAAALRTAESAAAARSRPDEVARCAKRSRRRDFPRRGSRCSRSSPGSLPTRCLKANNSKNGSGSPGPIPVRSRRSSFNDGSTARSATATSTASGWRRRRANWPPSGKTTPSPPGILPG